VNETNNDQNQKPKTSKLAIASILLSSSSFIIFVIIMMTRGGILHPDLSTFCITVLWVLGLSFGIVVRLRTRKMKVPLIDRLAIYFAIAFIFASCLLPFPSRPRRLHPRVMCGINLKGLHTAVHIYTSEYDGELPTAESWCDLLVAHMKVAPKSFVCPCSNEKEGKSSYAFNKNVAGMKLDEIPGDVVMLFETTPGWNQVGGPEDLKTEYHKFNGCNVLFADGYAEFVKTKDLGGLRWEP
jgi:prepilin-type processing-associated H-X9-DG protein